MKGARLLSILSLSCVLSAAIGSRPVFAKNSTPPRTETSLRANGKQITYPITSSAGVSCSSRNQIPCSLSVKYRITRWKNSTKFKIYAKVYQYGAGIPLVPKEFSMRIKASVAWSSDQILGTKPRAKIAGRNNNGGPQVVWPWLAPYHANATIHKFFFTLNVKGSHTHLSDIAEQGVVFNGKLYDNIPNTGPTHQEPNSAIVYVSLKGHPNLSLWTTVTFKDYIGSERV